MINLINKIPWQLKLIVLMLLMAILPSLLISYRITGLIRDELKSNIDGQLIHSSQSISTSINSKIKKSLEILDLIKKIIETQDLAADQKVALVVSSIEKIDNIMSLSLIVKEGNKYSEVLSTEKDVIRKEGNQVIPINNSLEKIDLNKVSPSEKKLPYISTPTFNKKIKSWVCTAIVSAKAPNLPLSYLVAQIDLSDIAKEIENHLLNRIGILFVIDSTGQNFLSSKLKIDLPDKITSDVKELLKSSMKISKKENYSDPNYGNYIYCFSEPDIINWGVVASIHEDAAYATVHDAFILFAYFVGISALLSILIAALFSKHLSKPIIKMAEISGSIADGKFDVNINYDADDSIGLLSGSLSKMGKQLKQNFSEIEEQKKQLEDYSKNLEIKVEQRTMELSESNKEIKKAYKKVLELNEEKNEFLGIAAHDLKNPLIAISSFAEIIKDEKELSNTQRGDFLNEIVKASSRMFLIIKNLLDVNSIEQGNINIKKERISLLEINKELILQFQNAITKKNINLILTYESNEYEIIADSNITLQIIQNILSNAIKFSPPNKNIYLTVKSSPDNKQVEVRIKDEGPGFTDSDKKKLFQKFARLSARPTDGEDSTGLGLSIAKKLVELINGSINLESESGKGAEFIITFPKADENDK